MDDHHPCHAGGCVGIHGAFAIGGSGGDGGERSAAGSGSGATVLRGGAEEGGPRGGLERERKGCGLGAEGAVKMEGKKNKKQKRWIRRWRLAFAMSCEERLL